MGARRMQTVGLCSLLLLAAACSDTKKGKSIGAPAVKPPVDRNMPSGFSAGSLSLEEATLDENGAATAATMASQIKEYLYPANNGPSPLYRLEMIDERMASLNRRAEDSARKCLDEPLQDYTAAAATPTGETLSARINCAEALSDLNQLAFGLGDGRFYLIEKSGSSQDSAIWVYANASEAGTEVDTWTVNYQARPQGVGETAPLINYMHTLAVDDQGIEVTTAGTVSGYSLSCGIHFKSNETYLFVRGSLSIALQCTTPADYCLDAVTLQQTDMSRCIDAGIDQFELESLSQSALTASISDTQAITDAVVTGVTDFNEDKN